MDSQGIKGLIEVGLPEAMVQVFSDDNTHFEAVIVAGSFAGKGRLARHQEVYRCLGERMGNDIHALSIRAYTPDEWQRQRAAEAN
ncbi:MAG: BolA/IbaG family iron-sulfur metabolism protein [Woeseia sp.]